MPKSKLLVLVVFSIFRSIIMAKLKADILLNQEAIVLTLTWVEDDECQDDDQIDIKINKSIY